MQKYLIAILPVAAVALGNSVFNAVGFEGDNFSVDIIRTSDGAPYKALGTWVPDLDVAALCGLEFDIRIAGSGITEAQYEAYASALLFNVAVAPEIPRNIFAAFLLDNGLEFPPLEI